MKQISAENVFTVSAWMKQQTGEKLKDLPEISVLDGGRFKCELFIPGVEVLIACAGNTRLEAVDRLFAKAVSEIKKYCSEKGLEVPVTLIGNKLIIYEEGDKLEWGINPIYSSKTKNSEML